MWGRQVGEAAGTRKNRLSKRALEALITARVLVEAETWRGAEPWFVEYMAGWMIAPEGAGGAVGRCIMHPKASNAAVPPPPGFVLPSPAQVARALSKRRVVWRADARAHFFQIPLPRGLEGAFRLVVEGTEYVLTRLPMGARMSPVVGDAVSRWMAGFEDGEEWGGEVEGFVYIVRLPFTLMIFSF